MSDPLEAFTFSSKFEIEDFFSRQEESIEITPEPMSGYAWKILVYPRGTDEWESDLVAVKLVNISGKPVKASYTITLFARSKLVDDLVWKDPDGIVDFTADGPDSISGCEDLMTRSELKGSEFCVNDVFKCEVIVDNYSPVDLMLTPLALAARGPGTQQDLLDIANDEISRVVIPLVGPRAGEVESLQDSLVGSRL